MSSAIAMSPEEIRQQVTRLGEWFQNLDLKGVATAPGHFLGDYPAVKWQKIQTALPARMDGLSVLDIGCNAGFHALECKRRGAARVLGIDADSRYLAQARFAAEVLELDIEWRQMSVYALANLTEQFDWVLFLGVFYHLRYPLYALDLVAKRMRGGLVFQTMIRGADAAQPPAPDYEFWDQDGLEVPGFPRMSFIEQNFAGDATNWWIPNRAAVEGMLRSGGLRIEAHPEAETWVCCRDPNAAERGDVWDLELAATL
ncbi:MAG TPA: TIGR04290 family methyltransferase [Terriglobales bacterium]|nr:TIGR04290 family methyltransferase [Terriglobales bacterium]